MKLKKAIVTRTRKSEKTLTIGKNGVLSFSKAATDEIVKDNHIDLFQDEEDPFNWYLHVSEEGSIKMRLYKEIRAITNASNVQKQICRSTNNFPNKTIKAKIGKPFEHEGMTLYPLLINKGDVTNF